ncbi:ATP-dependent DNA helicase [Trichonephila clavata]|uniref:ATP-dependent DNA helicase n=1 Tax=Trichonephila clavata TaxID=2740835 RepID=A0A8X6HIL9_TRICU|nr:ATP-dependent DNA helicase [Trichonephila clavata]
MWHLTQYYELNEIMRQKDDKTYAELLNRLALGELTDKDVELLKTKQTILEKVPKSATLLYHSNHDVNLANKLRLNSIEDPLVKSQAYDSVSGTAPNSPKQKVLDKVRNFDRTKTGNLESVIKFKVGAKYMLTYNIDTADGLVNGAVGQLKKLEYCSVKGSNNQEVKRIWLEFPNPNDIGKEKRRQCIRYSVQNKMGLLWTPIEQVKKVVYRSNNDAISVTRNQFPIILAEAMTIHKSQGATFQEAAVGFKRNLTRPLQYVALSRVTSIQGLYILGEYKAPPPPREDDLILQEMKRLKAHSILPK